MNSKTYQGEHNQYVAYPLGGTGAGMFCLEGTGSFSHFSIYHRPEIYNEPVMFSALHIGGAGNAPLPAVLLEGQVPGWKVFRHKEDGLPGGGNGLHGKHYGLPRFQNCSFSASFPFGHVKLWDEELPVQAEVTGWSPFIPNNTVDSFLPAAGVEYTLTNTTDRDLDTVFSFHCQSFIGPRNVTGGRRRVERTNKGLLFSFIPAPERKFDAGWLFVQCDLPQTTIDPCWMRGFVYDDLTMVWKHISNGDTVDNLPYAVTDDWQSPGGSLYVPLTLPAHGTRTVTLRFSWYVPESDLRQGSEKPAGSCCCQLEEMPERLPGYKPWYAAQFASIQEVEGYWAAHYDSLKEETGCFTSTLYGTTLDDEIMDAVTANLCILKSPTILRQEDGRLWGFEGCCDNDGCCFGSCTHVWNYAQAICHLFPEMEKTLRDTEFHECQDEEGHQCFRASIPIRPSDHAFHAAADGQLGGIIKVYRDYHINNDRPWLQELWPLMKKSLSYCILQWDRERAGVLKYPHHNTYDIEFWGPDGMNQSIYVMALYAMAQLAEELEEDNSEYLSLYQAAKDYLENKLFNGSYFYQRVMYKELQEDFTKVRSPLSPESRAILEKEGPHYQYGTGCLSDGIIGDWMGMAAGLSRPDSDVIDRGKVASHLASVFRYNFRESLLRHPNPQRPGYACSDESGLLLCTWPQGGKPTLPFIYSDEVWTGIEYQAAAHMASKGLTEEAKTIVTGTRSRYDGHIRNPFNEYECGHWYARAMSSYSLLHGFTGIRYDAVTREFFIAPHIAGDFSAFISTATGYGLAGVKDGKPFLTVVRGEIPTAAIHYFPFKS